MNTYIMRKWKSTVQTKRQETIDIFDTQRHHIKTPDDKDKISLFPNSEELYQTQEGAATKYGRKMEQN